MRLRSSSGLLPLERLLEVLDGILGEALQYSYGESPKPYHVEAQTAYLVTAELARHLLQEA